MKALVGALILIAITGCQTPPGVRETAGVVSKLTTQLNGTLADYVASSNAQRVQDEQRLALEEEQTARQAAANAAQFQILELAGDDRARALLTALRAPIDPTMPSSASSVTAADAAALTQQFGKNSFDTSPLTQVATIVGPLAQPLDRRDQLSVLLSFSQEVYGDLKAASTSPASAAGSSTKKP